MGTISFKNIGEKYENRVQRAAIDAVSVPLGIVTPLRHGSTRDGIFAMHYALEDQIQDNFRNLLLTNHGDRVIQCDLGANLQPLTFEYVNKDDFDVEAMMRINTAVGRYMPFIVLESYESSVVRDNDTSAVARIDMRIVYTVPAKKIVNKVMNVSFFIGG